MSSQNALETPLRILLLDCFTRLPYLLTINLFYGLAA